MSIIWTIIIFLLVFSGLVLAHELGHFIAARIFHAKVLEFGLGYPPRLKKLFTSKKGTDFTLNWLPLGGFVALAGEAAPEYGLADDGQDSEVPVSEELTRLREIAATSTSAEGPKADQLFYIKPAWQRFLVILAGPIFSLITGIILFTIIYSVNGIPELYNGARIKDIAQNSPAERAGMTINTTIVKLQDLDGLVLDSPSTEQTITFISNHQGQDITIVTQGPCDPQQVSCADQPLQTYDHVRIRTSGEIPEGQGALGVTFTMGFYLDYPAWKMPFMAIGRGFQESFLLVKEILNAFAMVIAGFITGENSATISISGPVGIVAEVEKQGIFKTGFWGILSFAAMLSINLGVINILPIPAVDGGQMLMIVLEKFFSKEKIDKIQGKITAIGFAFLVFLMIFITFRDIINIIQGG